MSVRILQGNLSKKINSLIKDILTLEDLSANHETLNFEQSIEVLQEQKKDLIHTQSYLDECENELSDKLEEWLNNRCKGKIQILLTGKEDGHKIDKEDSSIRN